MKKILILQILVMVSTLAIQSQVLKPMNTGLPGRVHSTCLDSANNLFAATNGVASDSIKIYLWDSASRVWNVYCQIQGRFPPLANKSSMQFYHGELIVTGIQKASSTHTFIYAYNGSTWRVLARVSHGNYWNYWGNFRSFKMNNKVYFGGEMDSFNGVKNVQIMEFNGSTFTNTGYSYNLWSATFLAKNDTLLVSSQNKIYGYKNSSWFTYYTAPNFQYIYGMTIHKGDLIISESETKVKRLRNKICIDSIILPFNRSEPTSAGNRILISYRDWSAKYNNILQTIYSLDDNFKLTAVARNQFVDSSALEFRVKNDRVFVTGVQGIKYNAYNFNNIGEMLLDSIKDIPIDTIVLLVYRDKNKNDSFDGNDVGSASNVSEVNSKITYTTAVNGYLTIYALDDEDKLFEYIGETIGDSCYKVPFSGARSALTYNSPITRDTVKLPLWRTTLQNRNVGVYLYGGSASRLSRSTNIYAYVFNKDCDAQTASVTLRISLDSGTILNSSTPNYSSKSGNILTYNLNLAAYSSTYIIMGIEYPSSKYSIGQKIKQAASIQMGFAEDSSDNYDTLEQRMVYSYDPNSKHCTPEGKVYKDLDKIRYTIEFQNEGNADAWRVRVVDTINLSIPVTSFQMVGTSHPYTVSVKNNVVTWIFDNIYLKPKTVDEAKSRGFIVFDAKLNTALRVGDSIRNRASIYFDLNSPVHTAHAVIIRSDMKEGIDNLDVSDAFKVYPNPAQDGISICNMGNKSNEFKVYDCRGIEMGTYIIESNATIQIDTKDYSPGIYIISTSAGGSRILVIE